MFNKFFNQLYMKKLILFLWIAFYPAFMLQAQVVNPLQTGHYMGSFINVRDYTKPSPGMYFMLYDAYNWGDSYYDRNGNKLTDIKLSELHPSLPNINVNMDINAFTAVPAIFWASKFNILGATYTPMVLLPAYTYAKSKAFGEIAFGSIDSTASFNQSGTSSGFGDTYVQPFGLVWGGKLVDIMIDYGFYIPTGRYEKGGNNNIGLGYWTHQFQGFGYLYPVEDKSTALMLGLTYEVNGKIKGTDIVPGQRFTLEWGISQYLSERLEVCVQGSNNWQVSDDKGDDEWWDPSIHDKKSTLAFAVNYWVVADKLFFGLKYGFDFAARQRFKTNLLMFNIIYAPGILAGKKK